MWYVCTRTGQADLGSCVSVISFTSKDLTHPSQIFPKLFVKNIFFTDPCVALNLPDSFLGTIFLVILNYNQRFICPIPVHLFVQQTICELRLSFYHFNPSGALPTGLHPWGTWRNWTVTDTSWFPPCNLKAGDRAPAQRACLKCLWLPAVRKY